LKQIKLDYWEECLSSSFEEHGVNATPEQFKAVAKDVQAGHDNYGMAFYSPPGNDRMADMEREWQKRYNTLKCEFDKYRKNAEMAVRISLKQPSDVNLSIGDDGEVTRCNGRISCIQWGR
jgi:hypothetical protein